MLDHGLHVRLLPDMRVLPDRLAAALTGTRSDPFAADVIAVPGPGMQRWLAQHLSRRLGVSGAGDGVCAGIDFPTVGKLVGTVEADILGIDSDPWSSERLVWAVLRAFDAAAGEDWFAPVRSYLSAGDTARPGRRYATARRVATIIRHLGTWRPTELGGDSWPARLWRLIADVVGAEPPWERLERAVERLRTEPGRASLPSAVHVVAPRQADPAEVRMLSALGAARTVAVWAPVAAPGQVLGDGSVDPLVAALGRAGAASTRALIEAADSVEVISGDDRPATLLGAVQARVGGAAAAAAPVDESIAFHASHGPDRQVDVLRDVLVGLLESDPTLEPRDIVVACPDLTTYAPLVRAACQLPPDSVRGDVHPGNHIRVQVADRSLRQANPVVDVLSRVLALASSRGGVSELLDLCATAPVARRFGFDADDLKRLPALTEAAGIRWGIDQASRARFGLGQLQQNTWQAGLNRLLLGVTLSERDLAIRDNVLPLDEVESSVVGLVGRLAEVVSRVRAALASFATPAPPDVWAARFRETVDSLVAVSAADAWQLGAAYAEFADLVSEAGEGAPDLALGDIRSLVTDRFSGLSPRSALLTGNLTVTSLEALRHVPHRVVCLVGLDEASFPGHQNASADDPVAHDPLPGEPNTPLDDRQLFLDALMSATERFVAIYRGRDAGTNAPVPEPLPVRDLFDEIDRIAGRDSRHRVVTAHRLQAFDPATFSGGSSYDRAAAAGARALARARSGEARPVNRFDVAGLPEPETVTSVTLEDLVRFLQHPVRQYVEARLGQAYGVSDSAREAELRDDAIADTDAIPLEFDALDAWSVTDRMLSLALAGHALDDARSAELFRGVLPPTQDAIVQLDDARAKVTRVLERVQPLREPGRTDRPIELGLPSGVLLTGRVETHDQVLVRPLAGRPNAKRRLRLWVELLAVQATDLSEPFVARAVGPNAEFAVTAPRDARAMGFLADLVDLYLTGRSTPIPMPITLASEWPANHDLTSSDSKAFYARDEDPYWRMFFHDWYDVVAERPGAVNFRTLAARVWDPIRQGTIR